MPESAASPPPSFPEDMPVTERLRRLGIVLPQVPKPLGAYAPVVVDGDLAWVSGQLPLVAGKLAREGRLGETVSLEEGKEAARLCFLNALAALSSASIPLERVSRVVKLVGHMLCEPGFKDQPQVLNGASETAHLLFGSRGVHARAALGAFALPLGATVELEAWFRLAPA